MFKYIFIVLAILIAAFFILNKKKIVEGNSNQKYYVFKIDSTAKEYSIHNSNNADDYKLLELTENSQDLVNRVKQLTDFKNLFVDDVTNAYINIKKTSGNEPGLITKDGTISEASDTTTKRPAVFYQEFATLTEARTFMRNSSSGGSNVEQAVVNYDSLNTMPETGECAANCRKATTVTGSCEGDNTFLSQAQQANPFSEIVIEDGKRKVRYYYKCPHECNMAASALVEIPEGVEYDVEKHGCRYSSQCKFCEKTKVYIEGEMETLVHTDGTSYKAFKPANANLHVLPGSEGLLFSSTESNQWGNTQNDNTQWFGHSSRWQENPDISGVPTSTSTLPSTSGETTQIEGDTVEELLKQRPQYKRLIDMIQEGAELDVEAIREIITNLENAGDTSMGNFFTDTLLVDLIGKKDMSLKDFYYRLMIQKMVENRLGGSRDNLDYLQYMPENGDGQIAYYDSAWNLAKFD